MSKSIGQKLAAARKKRDLTIEDIAHETRIHWDTLRRLEADDYSSFANLTYAKSFLAMYSQYLGLDMSEYLKEMAPAKRTTADEADHRSKQAGRNREDDALAPGVDPERRRPVLVLLTLFAIVCVVPGMYFLGRMHGLETASNLMTKTPPQPASKPAPAAPKLIPSPEPEPAVKPAPKPPEPPASPPQKVVSAQPEVIEQAVGAKPATNSNPVEPAAIPSDGPPSSPDPSGMEVRRPAILLDDEETSAATPPAGASTGPEVRKPLPALPVEAAN